MSTIDLGDTADYPGPQGDPLQSRSAHVRADLAGLSHPGRVRPNNEDHFLIIRFGRMLETVMSNLPADMVPGRVEENGYGLLVADGVGGAAAGEVASRVALSTFVQLALSTPDWILRPGNRETRIIRDRMAARYREVDAILTEAALADRELTGMSTTMTLAFSLGENLLVGHIGDSRAYVLRGGRLLPLTRDHTLLQQLADNKEAPPDSVPIERLRHILTRCLGRSAGIVEPDMKHTTLAVGDRLLLCTDGLTEMVDEPTIAAILQGPGNAQALCEALVERALANGGRDNVTVVVACYSFLDC